MSKAFEWYARSYKVEVVESKYPLAQLETSKSSIKGLFKDLLKEMKGFKYQITVKVLLKINKRNGKSEFVPVYFNYATKTVINFEYDLDKSFQEVLYRIDNPINEGSGWIIECIDDEHENISLYHSPLVHYQEVHTLILKVLIFLCLRRILARLKRKTKFALMCFVMKTNWLILFIYQIKTLWTYYWLVVKISHIMSKSRIFTDLCSTKQSVK